MQVRIQARHSSRHFTSRPSHLPARELLLLVSFYRKVSAERDHIASPRPCSAKFWAWGFRLSR